MHRSRKLPLVTAVNVDGNSLRFIPRNNSFKIDTRIPHGQQHDNDLYKHNDYDRGHMVCRLDPVWGDFETAKRANDDSFFYTNVAPQHKNLNQKLWVQLEEHILDNADAHDLKISVFTGPVFDTGDPLHRGVRIPRQFWKIVAFLEPDSLKLRSSGYILDQSHLIVDMPEEFSFGAFKTFHRKVDNGWGGLKVVSEGDSWFQYPVLLNDVIDQLFDEYAILSFDAAGNLLNDMVQQNEIVSAIAAENAHACLLSGGGNDLLGNGRLKQYLKKFNPDRLLEDYFCAKTFSKHSFIQTVPAKSSGRRLNEERYSPGR